jgi:TolC family type I secretion outer membrane protein
VASLLCSFEVTLNRCFPVFVVYVFGPDPGDFMRFQFAFLSMFSVALLAVPGTSAGQSLTDALAEAYLTNPTLDAQRAFVRGTDELVPQALSNWRPFVEANLSAGGRILDGNNSSGFRNGRRTLYTREAGVALVQPIFRGGRTLADTRSAENTVTSQRAGLTDVEQQVLQAAVTAYMNVFRDQAVLELLIKNEQRLSRQFEASQDRFQVGEVTRTDVFQAEARLARATADRISGEGDLERSRAVYRNIVGSSPGQLAMPTLPEDLPPDLSDTIKLALDNNPVVVSAEYAERSALDDVDSVKGELLPEVSLRGEANRAWEETQNDGRIDTLEALVNVSIPLYQSGAVYSRVRQAKQIAAEARRNIDEAQRIVIEDATAAWADLDTAKAAIVSFRKEVEANEVALEGVEREAEVGARTVLDILDAEQELVDSQVNLVRAQRDMAVATYAVKASVGDLTAERLGLQVAIYRPEEHYEEVRGKFFGGSSSGDTSFDQFGKKNP